MGILTQKQIEQVKSTIVRKCGMCGHDNMDFQSVYDFQCIECNEYGESQGAHDEHDFKLDGEY